MLGWVAARRILHGAGAVAPGRALLSGSAALGLISCPSASVIPTEAWS